jgi:hypothetical protein
MKMNKAVEIAMMGTTDKIICEAIPLNLNFIIVFTTFLCLGKLILLSPLKL